MLTVESLSKNYGRHEALKGISFSVAKGDIVGVLGLNGAGKSTLMKVLSGYLPPSSGKVTLENRDIMKNSLEIRSRLGYLSENNSLYPEMRVEEYLRFRAALKRVPRRRITEKVIDVLDLCGLRSAAEQRIGILSKGYRQRVGLADALVNEPDLLILDEPTLGLDPHQQQQMHTLMKGLAKRHTLLLSTHLLNEVEMICNRMMILHHGSIVAMGSPSEFTPLEETFLHLTQREEN